MTARRRANGEGEAPRWLDASHRWRARYTEADGARKSVYSSIPGPAGAAACRAKRDEAIGAIRDGRPATGGGVTLETYLTKWLTAWIDTPAHEPRTVTEYRRHVERHIVPVLGHRRLSELRAIDIQLLINKLAGKGLSGTMRRLVFDTLSRALNRAMKDRLIRENPCSLLDAPRRDTKRIEVWTTDQAEQFLASVEGDRYEALWNACLLLGLRRGEALGLRWSDIDWETNTLTIGGQLDRFTRAHKPRKGHGEPVVHVMPERVRDLLWARRSEQKRERIHSGRSWAGNALDLVFTTRDGAPIQGQHAWTYWTARVKAAGLPHMKLHGARHYAASAQYAGGARHEEVAQFLGHADGSTVTRIYVHLGDKVATEAAERMNRLFPARTATSVNG